MKAKKTIDCEYFIALREQREMQQRVKAKETKSTKKEK